MISVHVENKQVSQNLERLGPAVDGVVNADIQQALENAHYDLQQPGSPIKYPVQWDSEKQRRAYFASNGFGAGIPYARIGAYNAGWEITKTGHGTAREFSLRNIKTYWRFVGGGNYGREQSRIHRGRWAIAYDIVKKHVEGMLVNIREGIREAIHGFGMGL